MRFFVLKGNLNLFFFFFTITAGCFISTIFNMFKKNFPHLICACQWCQVLKVTQVFFFFFFKKSSVEDIICQKVCISFFLSGGEERHIFASVFHICTFEFPESLASLLLWAFEFIMTLVILTRWLGWRTWVSNRRMLSGINCMVLSLVKTRACSSLLSLIHI